MEELVQTMVVEGLAAEGVSAPEAMLEMEAPMAAKAEDSSLMEDSAAAGSSEALTLPYPEPVEENYAASEMSPSEPAASKMAPEETATPAEAIQQPAEALPVTPTPTPTPWLINGTEVLGVGGGAPDTPRESYTPTSTPEPSETPEPSPTPSPTCTLEPSPLPTDTPLPSDTAAAASEALQMPPGASEAPLPRDEPGKPGGGRAGRAARPAPPARAGFVPGSRDRAGAAGLRQRGDLLLPLSQIKLMHLDEVNFCPRCGSPLQLEEHFGKLRPSCPACRWIYFSDPKVAVALLVVDQGRVLLARRANDPFRGDWTLPGGFVDAGEDPARAAERECLEETGLAVRVTRLLDVIAGQEHPRGAHILIVYQGELISGSIQAADDALEVAFFGLDQLPKLAFRSTSQILATFYTNS